MTIPYDVFTSAFLSKISEYDFITLPDQERQDVVDGYMLRALTAFRRICKYDFQKPVDEHGEIIDERYFVVDVPSGREAKAEFDIYEIVEIVAEGMVVQWLKPYVYQQENLQNVMNTRDYSLYSPAELLMRVGNAYAKAQKDYTQLVRDYSYNNGDLTVLHL